VPESIMNLSVPLKQQLGENCPWLFEELGFVVVYHDYAPVSFGDSLVILESPVLRVRFVRDRGQVLAAVGSAADPGKWWPVTFVLEAYEANCPSPTSSLRQSRPRCETTCPD